MLTCGVIVSFGSPGDLNNGPWDNSENGRNFPRRLFLFDSNNDLSLGQSNLGQMEGISVQVPTCGLLVSTVSGQGLQA